VELLFKRQEVDATDPVASNDSVRIDECTAPCGRFAPKCGDLSATVEFPQHKRLVIRRGNHPLTVLVHSHVMDFTRVPFQRPPREAKPEDDPAHLIRRAIMLRIGIERFRAQILDSSGTAISPGVVRAFLRVRKFEHGARSLESLVSQSLVSSSFEASDVPPEAVLRLHVDESFEEQRRLGLVGIPVLEALAKACHDAWWKQKQERFKDKPDGEDAKAHETLKDYATAPKKYVDNSRRTARATEAKLATLGFRIVRKSEGEAASLGETEISRLVEIEHDIWLRDYLQRGYERAIETRDILCQHRCICLLSELSEADQGLDSRSPAALKPR
jgi:hypothetical protein